MKRIAKRKGYALATILILLGVTMFAATAIISVSILESKISRSQKEGITAYYASEAGVEDALWRLKNTNTYASALLAGNLDQTYTANNFPVSGESFTVHAYTDPAKGAGYALVDVTGTSNNGTFTAQRKITASVFEGPIINTIGSNAVFAGGAVNIGNGNSTVKLHSGDLYGGSSIVINNASVNLGTQYFQTPGTYAGSGTIVSGGVHSSNNPPAGPTYAAPGFDFTYYGTSPNYTVKYTPTQFNNLINAGGATVNIPGPITYVDGDLKLSSGNQTLNITGMLIINGSFDALGQAKNTKINVNDPGNGKAGIFVRTDIHAITGAWNINGVVYGAGGIHLNNAPQITINGGFISGGDIAVNVKSPMDITYNATRVEQSLGTGQPDPVRVTHWEEQY